MQLKINLNKSVEQNAADYYEKSKKLKKKIDGTLKAIEVHEDKLDDLKMQVEKELKEKQKPKVEIKREWYDKFHWFTSSDGFLVIGGRDATTNELIIKKHAEPKDLVFHTEMPGSPFTVIKAEGKEIPETTIREAAEICVIYSRAWKNGFSPEVFYVNPDQVTKEARAGEFIAKGAFMIYGKKNFIKDFDMRIAVGIKNGQVMGGPITAVQKHAEKYVIVVQGDKKKSDLAKQVRKEIGGELDEIMLFLPGEGKLLK